MSDFCEKYAKEFMLTCLSHMLNNYEKMKKVIAYNRMKHNERARVAPLDFLKILLVHRKNTTRTPRARNLAWCLVRLLAVVGLFWARSLARSARLDPSACSLNARGALSVTVSRTIS